MYGIMDDILKFATTFKDYPPRSIPPSFNPATIMDETLKEIRIENKIRARLPLLQKNEGEKDDATRFTRPGQSPR
jgi:arylsulfatase